MDKVKIRDIKTNAVIEVDKRLASDYIGTKRYETIQYNKSKNLESKPLFKNDKD